MEISSDRLTNSNLDVVTKRKYQETESLLIAAQNNAIRTNYVETKIDNMRQNRKYRLCRESGKNVNHMVGECRKLAQKDKTRLTWVGKMIN